jgi:malate synthase
MEDAATAEISRAQIWHWIRSPLGILNDGRKVTKELFSSLIPEELDKIKEMLGTGYQNGKYAEGAKMFEKLTLDEEFVEFLTLPAYEEIIQNGI